MRKTFWLFLILGVLVPILGYPKALNQVWRMGTSGNIPAWGPVNLASTNAVTGQLARTNLPTVGQQLSSSSGTFASSAAVYTDVTNLSVTITTTGRPVMLATISDGLTDNFQWSTNSICYAKFLRGATTVAFFRRGLTLSAATILFNSQPPNLFTIDPVAAGTYTYKVQIQPFSVQCNFDNAKLIAFEL